MLNFPDTIISVMLPVPLQQFRHKKSSASSLFFFPFIHFLSRHLQSALHANQSLLWRIFGVLNIFFTLPTEKPLSEVQRSMLRAEKYFERAFKALHEKMREKSPIVQQHQSKQLKKEKKMNRKDVKIPAVSAKASIGSEALHSCQI